MKAFLIFVAVVFGASDVVQTDPIWFRQVGQLNMMGIMGVDFIYHDLGSIQTQPEACFGYCQSNEGCTYYGYYDGRCWLHSEKIKGIYPITPQYRNGQSGSTTMLIDRMQRWNIIFPVNPFDYRRSYYKVAVIWSNNCNIRSNVRATLPGIEQDMCIQYCAGNSKCTSFGYDTTSKNCYIKDGSSDGLENSSGSNCGFVPQRVSAPFSYFPLAGINTTVIVNTACDLSGNEIKTISSSSEVRCIEHCRNEADCDHFRWKNDICTLMNTTEFPYKTTGTAGDLLQFSGMFLDRTPRWTIGKRNTANYYYQPYFFVVYSENCEFFGPNWYPGKMTRSLSQCVDDCNADAKCARFNYKDSMCTFLPKEASGFRKSSGMYCGFYQDRVCFLTQVFKRWFRFF